ncbi:MAG: LptA/OstA family protein [Alphaproteobacteria bacterium]
MSNIFNSMCIIRVFFFGVFSIVLLCSLIQKAQAQEGNPDRDKPLEITADGSLEWHRNDLFFFAQDKVRAKQGETVLHCEELIARYRDSDQSNIDIYEIDASGDVRIISADSQVYGDEASYNIDRGLVRLTGQNLRLISQDHEVRARDAFVYRVADGRLEAIGEAVLKRDGDTIKGDKLVATFSQGQNGERELDTFMAVGNVVIRTPDEVLTGARGHYNAQTRVAELTDNVRIMRGDSFIEGERAQVNLDTNISQIFGKREQDGGSSDPGRVRAVFFP